MSVCYNLRTNLEALRKRSNQLGKRLGKGVTLRVLHKEVIEGREIIKVNGQSETSH
jgi:hypothetical protein